MNDRVTTHDGHTIAVTEPVYDHRGTHVPMVHFLVTFTHDYGTDNIELGGHAFPIGDLSGIDVAGIRRAGYCNPVITAWTPISVDAISARTLCTTTGTAA